MKANLFCFCLLLITGCGQPATTAPGDQPTDAVEHLADSPVTVAEVESLQPKQWLQVNLQDDQKLSMERLSDISKVIIALEGARDREIINWLGDFKNIGDGKADQPAFIRCHKDCTQGTCKNVCCIQTVGHEQVCSSH